MVWKLVLMFVVSSGGNRAGDNYVVGTMTDREGCELVRDAANAGVPDPDRMRFFCRLEKR